MTGARSGVQQIYRQDLIMNPEEHFEFDPGSVRAARRFVTAQLGGEAVDLDAVILLVTERLPTPSATPAPTSASASTTATSSFA